MPNHPSNQTLLRFLNGSLDDSRVRDAAGHVDTCTACQATLDAMIGVSFTAKTQLVEPASDTQASCGPRRDVFGRSDDASEVGECVEFSAEDRFMVLEHLASGGMGVVYRGFDRELKREVAIKVPRGGSQGSNAYRLYREADISAGLQHPGVVPVHERGRLVDGRPFVVMRLINGKSLLQLINEAEPASKLPEMLGIFSQVCQTMAYVHSQGVVHRDLKPANIMVGEFGEVQIIDWGLAKKLPTRGQVTAPFDITKLSGMPRGEHASQDTLCEPAIGLASGHTNNLPADTRSGAVMGSYGYMSPEQATGQATCKRADVFAIGGILYHILTGNPPLDICPPTVLQNRDSSCSDQPVTERIWQPSLDPLDSPPQLVEIVRNCMTTDPRDRPEDATVVNESLIQFLAQSELA